MKQKRKRAPGGGRKPIYDPPLYSTVTMRISEETKKKLAESAKMGRRSVSREVILRLEHSLNTIKGINILPVAVAKEAEDQ